MMGEESSIPIDLLAVWQRLKTSARLGPDCDLTDGIERWDYPTPIPGRGRLEYLEGAHLSCCLGNKRWALLQCYSQFQILSLFCLSYVWTRMRRHAGSPMNSVILQDLGLPDWECLILFLLPMRLSGVSAVLCWGKITDDLRHCQMLWEDEDLLYLLLFQGQISDERIRFWSLAIVERLRQWVREYTFWWAICFGWITLNASISWHGVPILVTNRSGNYTIFNESILKLLHLGKIHYSKMVWHIVPHNSQG